MLKTPVCDLLGIEHPVIQGGMTYLASAVLVAAVSDAGGLGILGTGNAPADWVREQIGLVRMLTDRPFGVNVMLRSPFAEEVMKAIIEEKVPVVATGGGDPSSYLPQLRSVGSKIVPVVSTVAASKRLEELGADAVVAEGAESGGHVGEVTTMALLPRVVDSVSIPVIAAGGIADGRGLAAALALGAQAIQMGTRFICTEECIAHPRFKERIIEADGRSAIVIGRSTGHPIRCLENELTREFLATPKGEASLEKYFRSRKLYSGVIEGNTEDGFLMAGQSVGLIKEIATAKEVVEQVVAEAEMIIGSFSRYLN